MDCDRAFITQFLTLALAHTRSTTDPSIGKYLCMPFPERDIKSWLQQASAFCVDNPQYQDCLGGSLNPSSFWRSPSQFVTWWKNTIERKAKCSKLRTCARSRLSGTMDGTNSAYYFDKRILFSKIIVALVDNIRNHSERFFLSGGSTIQTLVPYPPSYFRHSLESFKQESLSASSVPDSRDVGRSTSTSISSAYTHEFEPLESTDADFDVYTDFLFKIASSPEHIPFQTYFWNCAAEDDVASLFQ